MGIIEKQSIKGSIYSYIGVLIGFVTAGVLLPQIFSTKENGVIDLLISWSLVFATLATLGLNNVTIRLFPWFRNKDNHHNGFFGILFWVNMAGFLLALLLYYALRPWIIADSQDTSSLFIRYMDYIIPLTAFTTIYLVIDIYYSVLMNAVRGIFLKEFVQRVLILIVILGFLAGCFRFTGFILFYTIALSLPGIIIAVLLMKDGEFQIRPQPDFLTRELSKSLVSVAFFGVTIGFSNILILYMDRLMINSMIGLEATGIYGRAAFYGTLVSIPIRSVSKISAVVVGQYWKDQKHDAINQLYRDTSLHQLLFGLLIFIGIWGNIKNVFHILPNDYSSGRYVIFFMGIANLFMMASGISGSIMATSRHYRLLALFVFLFGILVFVTNLIFIPIIGIAGAALASAVSTLLYGLMRYVFLWFKYGMQPYTWKHAVAVAVAIAAYMPAVLIPDLYSVNHHYLSLIIDIGVRSMAVTIVFIGATLILNISPDLNRRWKDMLVWLRIK
ncbi:MAG: oligosaccharide flippase family protein [Bacteroidia bacterium]|nr:oligosaccharide flippase family protein [Bacteroidia bacterium]